MNKKLLFVFGTRPEAIKMAPLVKRFKKEDCFNTLVCVTAQHRDMLDQVMNLFEISPDYDLNLMKTGQGILQITSKVLNGLDNVLIQEKPDMIFVHGDTTTTFSSALSAFYQKIPVAHVEAGLRSYNKYSPYPEEMNRMLTGCIAELHFAPTDGNVDNLIRENINPQKIYKTGNTVIDAMKSVVDDDYIFTDDKLSAIDFEHKRVLLLTAHRRENWGEPLKNIFRAVRRIVDEFADIEVVFPMHLNPSIRDIAQQYLSSESRIHLIEPLEYKPFQNLISRCYLILTDSGGIQEEAPALGKPVLVLRTETERPEAVTAGTVAMAGVKEEQIYAETVKLLTDKKHYEKMQRAVNPYGDGKASERIVRIVKEYFNEME